MIEIIGYIATLTTVISFLNKDVNKLRLINFIACVEFILYGILIHSIPVILVNVIVGVINLFYLLIKKTKNKI